MNRVSELKNNIKTKIKHVFDFFGSNAENEKDIKSLRAKRMTAALSAAFLLIAFAVCYFTVGKQILVFIEDKDAFKAWLAGFGAWGRLIFTAIRALQTVVKIIPAEPLEIGAGYAFGTWGGLLYCSIGSFIGSVIILLLTKKFGIKLVELFVPVKKLDSLSFLKNKKNLNATLFIIYLIPSTPKDLITYFIGLTNEKIPLFLLITTIGRIPSIITSTWCGSTLGDGNYISAALIFAATAVLGLGGAAIYGKLSGRKKNESAKIAA